MKLKTKSLSKLIESTNKVEKAYIKKYLNRFKSKSGTHTSNLFSLIVKSPEFEDEKHRIKLNITKPVFANYKFQLYQLTLQALSEMNSNHSLQSKLLNALGHIEVLYNKSLFNDALVFIEKTKNDAIKSQEFRLLPQIIQWQMVVMQHINSVEKEFTQKKDQLLEESIKYLEIQKNITQYQQLKKDYQSIRIEFREQPDKMLEASKKILKDPLLKSEKGPLSSLAKLHFHQLSYLLQLGHNLNKALTHAQSMVKVLEDELGQEYIEQNIGQYVDAHFNILNSASEMKDKGKFLEVLHKMDELEEKYKPVLNEAISVHIFRSKYLLLAEHFHWLDAGDLIINAIPKIKEGINRYEHKIRDLIITHIYFGIGNSFFQIGNFNKAISWYSRVLHFKKESMFPTTFVQTNLMNLIAYHETKYIHIDHILKNAQKALQKSKLTNTESQIIHFLGHANQIKPDSADWPYSLW